MPGSVAMLACQIAVPRMTTIGQRDAHLDRIRRRLHEELSQRSADLVVLPELSSLDYSHETFAHLDELAEELEGPSFLAMREIAIEHQTTVLFGTARRDGDNYLISQIAIGPNGDRLGHFDKLHRANFGFSDESAFFTHSGDSLFVFECGGLRFAPIICYDVRFPELTRTLVLDHQADVILHCGAYGRDESFESWHAFVTTRAMENQAPMLSLNRAGALYGDSIFCGPWVDAQHPPVHFPEHDEAFLFIEVSRNETAELRERYRFLHDRLPSYRGLPLRTSRPGPPS